MANEKQVVPKLRQEMKVKVNIVTSDDIKINYIGKFQDFTARYIIKSKYTLGRLNSKTLHSFKSSCTNFNPLNETNKKKKKKNRTCIFIYLLIFIKVLIV